MKLQKLTQKEQLTPLVHKLKHGQSYILQTQALVHALVLAGCSQTQVGSVIRTVLGALGTPASHRISCWTVGRVILEGGIAAKLQLGSEISNAKGFTISGDSTSHQKMDIHSQHLSIRAPHYSRLRNTPNQVNSDIPQTQSLGVTSNLDHSSETSKQGWVQVAVDVIDTFNSSPLGKKVDEKLTMCTFLKLLKGMNGDHASTEKSTAQLLQSMKKDSLTLGDLVQYVSGVKMEQIRDIGGIEVWGQLTEEEHFECDQALMKKIIHQLGQDYYNTLPAHKKR
ncbi:hypothetical protein P691DRAFT_793961 [Macrolepiota fuliginosa MF-IS2]|uniref:Uncharacterized protein n=1 Tax=Macrolepiota fuliginosa MF-IS2 TaxID=1400762 RepID=A0A9P5WXM3_9AGAR|nr:hypothetical protein P691DRAFT_793961 [Macrolepiota fuliginosa MF-IS2]